MKGFDIELVDALAAKAHAAWMNKRAAEGWRYGLERDDDKKTNPCMVPYEDLPESEKDNDREMASKTIDALQELGYTVMSNGDVYNRACNITGTVKAEWPEPPEIHITLDVIDEDRQVGNEDDDADRAEWS